MKRELKALFAAGALLAPAMSKAEIVLTEDLSLYGYLDIYGSYLDIEGDNLTSAVGEFELGFNYTTAPYFAVVELSFEGTDGGNSDVGLETAIIGWNATEELSFSAGNILSYLGWETYDATGLYQNTYAYRGFAPLYPAYAVGISADYVTDAFSAGLWIGEGSDDDLSYEVMAKFTGVEGLTLFGAYADDPGYETINFWASYEVGSFIFAAEYVDVDNETAADATGYLAMINYAVDSWGFTFRYSVEETDGIDDDWEAFTFSPSYTFSDNLLGLAEVSLVEGAEYDYYYAIEFIYTF